ncbi:MULTISPECIES: uroporphyrinogen-III synthase [unclassified Beijerinckia]|uniref:uroporphyrinogen-III synthase n=1 Tax=unclassified Beijerinckia TaxID=2638183 RepID=UPI00089BEBE3|nr:MULTISPECIES: uroporphyrinogen-III synthase [unclassified Beijerinckia]MDH7798481.1 uroporphyrinogen-III synthase [Beijerinckia sp. GAS462]SED22337.1 uroporphyrinogen-III synthase [Beijerinckia sp. 28-YEA-48]
MRVLVTRPQGDAESTATHLVQAGHEAIIAPVLRIVPTGATVPGANDASVDYDGVIITSVHAFDAVIPDARFAFLFDKPLHSIGTRSIALARRANIFEDGLNGRDAAALGKMLLREMPRGTHLLYLAGRDRKPDLELALSAGGLRVEIAVVYDARAVETLPDVAVTALQGGALDAVLHYSRRSASIFADLVVDAGLKDQAARLRHVCISSDCAAGLVRLNVAAAIAAAPTEAAMIALLA